MQGPAKSVTYMTNLIKNNYSVSVICSSRDLGSKIHMNVHKNKWVDNDKISIFYGTSNLIILNEIRKSVSELKPDLIYVASFFDRFFSFPIMFFSKLIKSKLIIAPKGELFNGALRKKKK